jgi:hypothetical protein
MPGARSALASRERGLVRGAAGADRQPTAAGRAREPDRQRLASTPDRDSGGDAGCDVDLIVEQHRPLRIWALRNPGCPEILVPSRAVLDVHERTWVVARRREEPRLDQPPIADPLDPARALRQPHIPQPTAEQAPLTIARRHDSKRAKTLIDQISVDPSPSSLQRSSCLQLTSAGERNGRNRCRQSSMNAGSGSPNASTIRPRSRPDAVIAASEFVTSSGMICTRSTPPCAKFSRK